MTSPSRSPQAARPGRASRGVWRRAGAIAIAVATLWPLVVQAAGPPSGPRGTPPAPAGVAAADSAAAPAPASTRRKTAAYELVKFGRNVHVHEDEVVHGDVVLIGGELRVDGQIAGGAVVIGGDILAGPRARIDGQAVAVAGRVSAAPGAAVTDAVSLNFLSTPLFARLAAARSGEFWGDLLKLLVTIVLAWPLCAWFGASLERARVRLDASPLKCLGLGVLALPSGVFAVVVIAFFLALTLVGAPLAVLLVAVAVAIACVAFFVGAATIGARLRALAPAVPARLSASVVLGLVCLRLPELVADAMRWLAPARSVRALVILDGALEAAAIAAGLGALLWVRWSRVAATAVPGGPAGLR